VRYDHANKPVPELATVVPSKENGGISKDGLTITYRIRRGVKWSDGEPFDADDVKFSFDAVNNKANNVATRDGFDQIASVDVPDKATVVVRLRKPYSLFLTTFFASGQYCLLPKHVLGSLPNINSAPYNALPIGVGPFRYTAWHRGESVEMEANPYYWRGLPKLKKVVYKIIPDRNTVLTQLQTGELDLWYPFGGSFLPRVQSIKNVAVIRQPAYSYNIYAFNTSHPALADRAVRQALRLAIDRATLREKIGHGVGILQEAPLPPIYPGIAKVPLVPYDVAKANALLDRAGWKRGSDGVRAKNGTRLVLDFASSTGSPDVDSALELDRLNWQQIGIEMTIKRYPSSVLFAPFADGGVLYNGKFDVLALGFTIGAQDGLAAFRCDQIPPNGQNYTHYCNRKTDAYLDDFLKEYSLAGQAKDLNAALGLIVADAPGIVTTGREDLFAYNRDLKNFHPNAVTIFDDMMNVDI